MKKTRIALYVLSFLAMAVAFSSCNNKYDYPDYNYALVTVRPSSDSFTLQLDNKTVLYPSNMTTSPYGDKEVRALISYYDDEEIGEYERKVRIVRMDSIRTKKTVPSLGEENDEKYGDDCIEIVRDWVTVAEDGYLTLRVRALWGYSSTVHYINLLTGVNPDNPYELELRHDSNGDIGERVGDALIAFNLNDLPRPEGEDDTTVKIKLNWKSFEGNKSKEFDLYLRPTGSEGKEDISAGVSYNNLVK